MRYKNFEIGGVVYRLSIADIAYIEMLISKGIPKEMIVEFLETDEDITETIFDC